MERPLVAVGRLMRLYLIRSLATASACRSWPSKYSVWSRSVRVKRDSASFNISTIAICWFKNVATIKSDSSLSDISQLSRHRCISSVDASPCQAPTIALTDLDFIINQLISTGCFWPIAAALKWTLWDNSRAAIDLVAKRKGVAL